MVRTIDMYKKNGKTKKVDGAESIYYYNLLNLDQIKENKIHIKMKVTIADGGEDGTLYYNDNIENWLQDQELINKVRNSSYTIELYPYSVIILDFIYTIPKDKLEQHDIEFEFNNAAKNISNMSVNIEEVCLLRNEGDINTKINKKAIDNFTAEEVNIIVTSLVKYIREELEDTDYNNSYNKINHTLEQIECLS